MNNNNCLRTGERGLFLSRQHPCACAFRHSLGRRRVVWLAAHAVHGSADGVGGLQHPSRGDVPMGWEAFPLAESGWWLAAA